MRRVTPTFTGPVSETRGLAIADARDAQIRDPRFRVLKGSAPDGASWAEGMKHLQAVRGAGQHPASRLSHSSPLLLPDGLAAAPPLPLLLHVNGFTSACTDLCLARSRTEATSAVEGRQRPDHEGFQRSPV